MVEAEARTAQDRSQERAGTDSERAAAGQQETLKTRGRTSFQEVRIPRL